MRIRIPLCVLVVILSASGGSAQSPKAQPISDIRKVDFLNFTYRSSLCSREFGRQGITKTVRVVKGDFKRKSVYVAVDDSTIVFGDLTGDGQDEAVVAVECGAVGANFSRTELHVFTIKNGRTTLVGQVTDADLERDYRHAYPDAESYWGVAANAVKVSAGKLVVDVLADGPHASPKYTVTLEYQLNGAKLTLAGAPQRTATAQ